MIRRNVVSGRDGRVVKLSLAAAAVALSLGFYAQHALETAQTERAAVTAEAAPVVQVEAVQAAG